MYSRLVKLFSCSLREVGLYIVAAVCEGSAKQLQPVRGQAR
jgi:hypothetical protein